MPGHVTSPRMSVVGMTIVWRAWPNGRRIRGWLSLR
jgi:hypothetical protein